MTKLANSQITQLLLQKSIRPTLQRLKIMEYLWSNRVHPTADMIYNALKQNFPTFSKTTVYNTLKLLQDKQALTELVNPEGPSRYEINLIPHAHFSCIKCGQFFDLELTEGFPQYKSLQGHKVLECQVIIKGICNSCRLATSNPKPPLNMLCHPANTHQF